MKGLALILMLWFLLPGGSPLRGLEIHAETGLLFFNSGVAEAPDITGNNGAELNFIEDLSIAQRYTNRIGLDLILNHDPILLNRMIIRLGFFGPFFSIQAGPFIGLFNGPNALNPGISLTAEGKVSSFLFGSFAFDTTLGPGINQAGDYSQDRIAFQAGFSLPYNLLGSLGLHSRTYTRKEENSAVLTTNRIQYYFSLEYTRKIGYFAHIRALLGYEELKWTGSAGLGNQYYKNQSLYAGINLGFHLNPFLEIRLAAEIPFFSWITQNVQTAPVERAYLYECTLGITWKFDPAPR